jgi:hypothetical protein
MKRWQIPSFTAININNEKMANSFLYSHNTSKTPNLQVV